MGTAGAKESISSIIEQAVSGDTAICPSHRAWVSYL
jgi:hypothetical protein